LNKKREALRHGLRSFIEDTSRELADLEGRDLHPTPVPPAPQDGHSPVIGAANDAAPGSATAPVPAPPADGGPAATRLPPASPAVPAPPAAGGPAASHPPPASHAAPPSGAAAPVAEGRAGAAPAVPPPAAAVPAAPARRVGARRRPRQRPAPDVDADGVNPDQANARKGVCFAFFLNPACWRIPEAYCNSALQVCITRECPIYHLHKDALEARFARKFRHFW